MANDNPFGIQCGMIYLLIKWKSPVGLRYHQLSTIYLIEVLGVALQADLKTLNGLPTVTFTVAASMNNIKRNEGTRGHDYLHVFLAVEMDEESINIGQDLITAHTPVVSRVKINKVKARLSFRQLPLFLPLPSFVRTGLEKQWQDVCEIWDYMTWRK